MQKNKIFIIRLILNYTKMQILLLLWLIQIYFNLIDSVSTERIGNSNLFSAKERIFVRKKRLVIFSNYAAMKITVAVGKSLIAKFPRGVNLSLEASVYYPLPTSLEEWFPHRTTPTPTKTTQTPPSQNVSRVGTYSNGNLFNHNEFGMIWVPKNIYIRPSHSICPHGAYCNSTYFIQNPNIYIDSMGRKYDQFSKLDNSKPYRMKEKVTTNLYNEVQNKNGNYYKRWKFERAHHERRDIYNHFMDISSKYGFNIKTCILRAICESKHFLLPPGYSLFQDILRIFFSLPTIDNSEDEYSQAMKSEKSCHTLFDAKCQLSLLDFMLNAEKYK